MRVLVEPLSTSIFNWFARKSTGARYVPNHHKESDNQPAPPRPDPDVAFDCIEKVQREVQRLKQAEDDFVEEELDRQLAQGTAVGCSKDDSPRPGSLVEPSMEWKLRVWPHLRQNQRPKLVRQSKIQDDPVVAAMEQQESDSGSPRSSTSGPKTTTGATAHTDEPLQQPALDLLPVKVELDVAEDENLVPEIEQDLQARDRELTRFLADLKQQEERDEEEQRRRQERWFGDLPLTAVEDARARHQAGLGQGMSDQALAVTRQIAQPAPPPEFRPRRDFDMNEFYVFVERALDRAIEERQRRGAFPVSPTDVGFGTFTPPQQEDDELFASRKELILEVTVRDCPRGSYQAARAIAGVAAIAGVPLSDIAVLEISDERQEPRPGRGSHRMKLGVKLLPLYGLLINSAKYKEARSLEAFLCLVKLHEQLIVSERRWRAFRTPATMAVEVHYNEVKPPNATSVYTELRPGAARTAVRLDWPNRTICYDLPRVVKVYAKRN